MQAADCFEHAVDAVAYAQKRVLRFKVDIRGAALDRVDQQRIDQPHHRLRIFVAARTEALIIDLAGFDFLQDAVDRQFVSVELVDVIFELRFACQLGLDLDGRAKGRA